MNLTLKAYQIHCQWMQKALILAQQAGERGEIPIAALIIDKNNEIIAQATNEKELRQDPTAHAELLAIQLATQTLNRKYLTHCTLYVTLEPCPMCAGAIIHSRLDSLIYGADDPKTGAIRTLLNLPDSYCSNHRLSVIAGIQATPSRQILQNWFKNKRK